MTTPVALTMGEPAGIGADILIAASAALRNEIPHYVIGDPEWLADRAHRLGESPGITVIARPEDAAAARGLAVSPVALAAPSTPGAPDPRNAPAVLGAIAQGVADVLAGRAAALVTAPIAKAPLYAAGFGHPGHTEYLAALCADHTGAAETPMMLLESARAGLRVALATIHLPLAEALRRLTTDGLVDQGLRLARALKTDFGVCTPRIAVAGLNPHAGENGALGGEDIAIVAPAVAALQAAGVAATGPAPADTLFHDEARAATDAVLCLYHDQGLIPLKTLDFYGGVNITLGLPIVRTSPDHGTAFDLAGTGRARPDSMIAAIRSAAAIARRRAA